ncbi:MAG: hypothetical protein OXF56_15080, partial [Rhodobacteraceae bacterium]|nr:hypothetical protein [Paracoccaceae bacterium]
MGETREPDSGGALRPRPERPPQTDAILPRASISGIVRKILGQSIIGIQFVAVIVGMLAVLYEFQIQRPNPSFTRLKKGDCFSEACA